MSKVPNAYSPIGTLYFCLFANEHSIKSIQGVEKTKFVCLELTINTESQSLQTLDTMQRAKRQIGDIQIDREEAVQIGTDRYIYVGTKKVRFIIRYRYIDIEEGRQIGKQRQIEWELDRQEKIDTRYIERKNE